MPNPHKTIQSQKPKKNTQPVPAAQDRCVRDDASPFEKHYLTVADIRSYLCISSAAAYELTHRKDFPVCRFGSSIRIPADAFLAWVDKHTRMPADLAERLGPKVIPWEVTRNAG